MRSINHVVLTGNLTRDVETREVGETTVARMGLAVTESYKDRNGEWAEKTYFFDVDVWGRQGENCADFLGKGDRVTLTGKLVQDVWEDRETGATRSKVYIKADAVEFPSRSREDRGSDRPTTTGRSNTRTGTSTRTGSSRAVQDEFRDIDYGGDPIPF